MSLGKCKVTMLFLAGGFGSGVVTWLLLQVTLIGVWVLWLGVGAIFALGVGGCLLVARGWQWPIFIPSLRRYVLLALIATLAYPLSLLVMFELSLWFAAVGAALLVSCGLRLMTGMWDTRVSLLLVIGGIATVAALAIYPDFSALYRSKDQIPLLFVLGDTIFTALCGSWLARAYPQATRKSNELGAPPGAAEYNAGWGGSHGS